jgi:4-amino-4-deoxy-L-arabinose transferase-like glycosyltransferase
MGGFLLRCIGLFYPFLHAWDERYHALVAKNLAENPLLPLLYKSTPLPYHIGNWTNNHVWLHKPPMTLWMMSLSIKTFGNHEFAIRLPSILVSTVAIWLTYKIARFFYDDKIALLASFFHAINGLLLQLTFGSQSTDHIDVMFLFFVELCVYLIIRYIQYLKPYNLILIGVVLGIAILTKWLPALIVIPIFIVLGYRLWGFKKVVLDVSIIMTIALILVFPWQWYIYSNFPDEAHWESNYNWRHLTEVLEEHDGGWWWHILYSMKFWNEFILLAFVWFLFRIKATGISPKNAALALWVLIPYTFFSAVATKMVAYPVITAPAIFIILSKFWFHFKENLIKIRWLNYLLLSTLLLLNVRRSYERIRLSTDISDIKAKSEWVKSLDQKIDKPNAILFNTEYFIEIMFYTDHIAYQHIPEKSVLDDLVKKGYNVYMINNENVTKY